MQFAKILVVAAFFVASQSAPAQWMPQKSGTTARLRGLSVVNPKVAWASGARGTCVRTTDGGETWIPRPVPGGADLDFRDNHAVNADLAYVLAIGPGDKSRIYKTTNGGESWSLQYTNPDPKGFLDAIAFWDADHGLAMGDPVDGRFVILKTDDGGKNWNPIPAAGMPKSLPTEGAFAASGTCLIVHANGHAWFGTGGGNVSRVFRSDDWGKTWTAHETPVAAGVASAGIFSLAFHDENHGIAVGGDFTKLQGVGGCAAFTSDGGRTWKASESVPPLSFRSGTSVIPHASTPTFIAVGPAGTDVSANRGATWKRLSEPGFDAVMFVSPDVGWAVGEGGRIAKFNTRHQDNLK